MRALRYLYDPLCGWCYAATSGIARLRAAGVAVSLRPTGLFSDPGRVMTPEFADYAWKNDQRIAALTGLAFTDAYRRQVLQAPGTAFDSTNAVLALTAVAMDSPDLEADALRAVQAARYVAGRDITDIATLAAILDEAGYPNAAAAFEARTATLLSANAARVAEGLALLREVGGSGVPTLVLVDGERAGACSTASCSTARQTRCWRCSSRQLPAPNVERRSRHQPEPSSRIGCASSTGREPGDGACRRSPFPACAISATPACPPAAARR